MPLRVWNTALIQWRVHRELILFFAAFLFLLTLVAVVAGSTWKSRDAVPKTRPILPSSEKLRVGELGSEGSDAFGLQVKAVNPEMTFMEKQAIYLHAQKLYQLGATLQATEQYRVLVAQFPNDARLFNDYGNALRDLGKMDEAEKMYRRSFELEPHMLPAYTNLASMLLDAKKYTEAKRVIEDGEKANPDSEVYDVATKPLLEFIMRYVSPEGTS